MLDDKRFVCISNGEVYNPERTRKFFYHEILVDRRTGVNYLSYSNGGLTVLVDAEGRPIVSREYIQR